MDVRSPRIPLVIGPAADWFQLGEEGARVDLSRRGPARRMLRALVRASLDGDPPLSVERLVELGWPDEKILPLAARDRVYTTIRLLRRLGLGPHLEHRGGGYALSRDLEIHIGEAPLEATGPAEPGLFGRTEALSDLEQWWRSERRLLAVVGVPGIGKRSLASAWVHRHRPPLPSTWVEVTPTAAGHRAADLCREALSRRLEIPLSLEDPDPRLGDALALADTRLLVFVTDLPDLSGLEPFCRRLMERAPHLKVLLLAPTRVGLEAGSVLTLSGLSDEAALDLLRHRLRARGVSTTDAWVESEATCRVVRWTSGIPLLVDLVAAWLSVLSPEALLQTAETHPDEILDEEPLQPVHRILDLLWPSLGRAQRRALYRLAIFEGSFTLEDTRLLSKQGISLRTLRTLADRMLVEVRREAGQPWLYRVPPLLRLALHARRSEGDQATVEATRRHLRARLLDAVRSCSGPDTGERLAMLRRHEADLWALHRSARPPLAPKELRSLARCLALLHQDVGPFAPVLHVLDEALGTMAATSRVPKEERLALRRDRAWIAHRAGRGGAQGAFEALLAEVDPKRMPELHDRLELDLVSLLFEARELDTAAERLEAVVERARARGDGANLARALTNLSVLTFMKGGPAAAIPLAQEGQATYAGIGDRRGEGFAWTSLGNALTVTGERARAREALREALACHLETGNLTTECATRSSLAILAWGDGDLQEARATFEQARSLAQHRGAEVMARILAIQQAELLLELDADDEALQALDFALTDRTTSLPPDWRAEGLATRAVLLARRDEPLAARQALTTARAVAGDRVTGSAGVMLGLRSVQMSLALGDDEAAQAYLQSVLKHEALPAVRARPEVARLIARLEEAVGNHGPASI